MLLFLISKKMLHIEIYLNFRKLKEIDFKVSVNYLTIILFFYKRTDFTDFSGQYFKKSTQI